MRYLFSIVKIFYRNLNIILIYYFNILYMCASKNSFVINKFVFNNETLYLGDLNHYSKFL